MKNIFYAGCALLIMLTGCTCNNTGDVPAVDLDATDGVVIPVDSADIAAAEVVNVPPLWSVEVQGDNTEKLKEPATTPAAETAPAEMVQALNKTYPEIQLQLQRISNDTAYLSIPESAYLTQQIGSTGAYNYLATAVYNLTELKGVKYVTFELKEGDHAGPGTYSREDFKKLR